MTLRPTSILTPVLRVIRAATKPISPPGIVEALRKDHGIDVPIKRVVLAVQQLRSRRREIARACREGGWGMYVPASHPAAQQRPPQPKPAKAKAGTTSVALPRTGPPDKPFHGINWEHSLLRPGCQDALQHPSRRGDELVPHRAPIHACVGALRGSVTEGRD